MTSNLTHACDMKVLQPLLQDLHILNLAHTDTLATYMGCITTYVSSMLLMKYTIAPHNTAQATMPRC